MPRIYRPEVSKLLPSNSLILCLFLLLAALCASCAGSRPAGETTANPTKADACPVTEAIWRKPPEDRAVSGTPAPGYYFASEDQSILVSAWWVEEEEYPLRANDEGNKVGWFRPEGADLTISGRRIDAPAPPLKAEVPCCYAGKFQATGLFFPAPGCWEITGQSSDQSISFVVRVEP